MLDLLTDPVIVLDLLVLVVLFRLVVLLPESNLELCTRDLVVEFVVSKVRNDIHGELLLLVRRGEDVLDLVDSIVESLADVIADVTLEVVDVDRTAIRRWNRGLRVTALRFQVVDGNSRREFGQV